MSGHTAGPWAILNMNARHGLLTVGTVGPHGPVKHVAEMCWGKDVADKATGATGLADARLIAAAPDLLEIAERILERGYVSSSIDEERADHEALAAAIAKAKGEA